MQITILTVGTRGDVQPYVALGLGLQQAGHQVRVAAHLPFEHFIRSRGLDFVPVAGDPRAILQSEMGQMWLNTGWNPIPFVKRMIRLAEPIMVQMLDDFWQACQGAEVILYPVLATFAALPVAEKLGIQAFPAYLQHTHPTRQFPSVMTNPKVRLGPGFNQLTYPVIEQIFWQLSRGIINRWKRDILGLSPYSFLGPFQEMYRSDHLYLYGFSPSVLPKPSDWPQNIKLTGYWFLDRPDDWQPPAGLLDFLESGTPPVYVGFGSMPDHNAAEITEITLAAINQSKQRGLLLTGWGGLSNADLPDHIYKIEAAPHDWLFPQMAAVVHHGGAGTTAAGFRAAVPTVVVPFFGDQFFWGWRVAALGVGPEPISRKSLSAHRLAKTITEAVTNPALKQRALALGQRIQAEDGVAQAVAALNQQLTK